jgi:hypothetical protein
MAGETLERKTWSVHHSVEVEKKFEGLLLSAPHISPPPLLPFCHPTLLVDIIIRVLLSHHD